MSRRRYSSLLVLLACGTLVVGGAHGADDGLRTPSEQMKEAVDKLNKTPATIGKSLQGLTDAAKERLRQTFGDKTKPNTKPEPVDLNVPKKAPESSTPIRTMKEGSRDPFRSPLMPKKATIRVRENLSPLEEKDLGQLNLVGIVQGSKEPIAVLLDTGGASYFVNVGTPIGLNDGRVKAIYPDEVVIEEYCEDVYGARKKCVRSKRLRTE